MKLSRFAISIDRRRLLGAVAAGALATVALAAGDHVLAQHVAPRVALETSDGTIVIELAPSKAPKTVENFLSYVTAGHYDGTIFHRVIPTFMVQGGGFTSEFSEKPTKAPIPLEAQSGLKNVRGSVAMARRGDPNSATSQFFINVVDNPRLDHPNPDGHGYAVFGKVVEGMEVVDRIRAAPTGTRGRFENVPVSPPVIRTARIVK